ncbi:MAG: phenylalanine--tRNA ligase subunit alpha, partial [Gammaproteobacteria bacterium]|nr:phenylalanine--tRNA ligase subunit alpha [Gammaproteobacteria bacterium]
MTDLDDILQKATAEIVETTDLKKLDDYRVQYLGKK